MNGVILIGGDTIGYLLVDVQDEPDPEKPCTIHHRMYVQVVDEMTLLGTQRTVEIA